MRVDPEKEAEAIWSKLTGHQRQGLRGGEGDDLVRDYVREHLPNSAPWSTIHEVCEALEAIIDQEREDAEYA